jgi:hypothetical protein
MGFGGFYRKCWLHATKKTWTLAGSISTAATFGPIIAKKIFNVTDVSFMDNWVLVSVPVCAALCLIIVPWRESFRLYRDKELELEQEKKRHAQEKAALLAKFASPNEHKRDFVLSKIKTLDDVELGMLGLISVEGGQLEDELRLYLDSRGRDRHCDPGVSLATKSKLLERSPDGRWDIKPDLKQIVSEEMAEIPMQSAATLTPHRDAGAGERGN